MADEKPKADVKPKVEEKPTPPPNYGKEITTMLFMFFVFATLFGGLLASASSFISGFNSKSFSIEAILSSYTRPFPSVVNPIGGFGMVISKKTDVFDTPGGVVLGTQRQQALGKVVSGAVMVDGVNYWYIDFKKDPDGWVSENDLGYIDSVNGQPKPASGFIRLLLLVYSIGYWIRIILWFLILVLACLISYVIYNLTHVRQNTRAKLYQAPDEATIVPTSINKSWDRVLLFVDSYNESEWRLAVIEADMMLAELLDTMNLMGDSVGEKLKSVEKSDFNTLDLAWEAHKVRNQIAHDPSFILTQREAKRVIGLFEQVFKEFSFI